MMNIGNTNTAIDIDLQVRDLNMKRAISNLGLGLLLMAAIAAVVYFAISNTPEEGIGRSI